MTAFKTVYRRIYGTSCPKFNETALMDTRIGSYFIDRLDKEFTAESTVMAALMSRRKSLLKATLNVRDSLLLATQMHIFRNSGYIFLKFCHDKHPFPNGSFSKKFIDSKLTNVQLSRGDQENRPDVDTFEGLFEISQRMKQHVDGFTYRASYMRFNVVAEARDPAGGTDDASYGDSEQESEQPGDVSDVESASDHDVAAELFVRSPGPTTIDHMHAAAQAQGSPSKVQEFEESVRGSDEAVKKKKREIEEAEKMMQTRTAKRSEREKQKEKRMEPDVAEKEPEPEPEKEKEKEKKKRKKRRDE